MQVDVKVPGKQGPFRFRKLRLSELSSFVDLMSNGTMNEQCLFLVTNTLVNKSGKPVFRSAEETEEALGAVEIIDLGIQALKFNEIGKLANLQKNIDDALKN